MGSHTSRGIPVNHIRSNINYTIFVKTGDHSGAGTNANIYVILVNSAGACSNEIHLNCTWNNDFEAGNTDRFSVRGLPYFGDVTELELWRTGRQSDRWYLEWIEIQGNEKVFIFPIHRWIVPNHRMQFQEYDCVLPQFDKFPQQRKIELAEKKRIYAFAPKHNGIPCQVTTFPKIESFSNDYQWKLFKTILLDKIDGKIIKFTTGRWKNLDDLANIYNRNSFPVPAGMHCWRSDIEFGRQRLTGCNPGIIRLCTYIPNNFGVTKKMIQPLMEGLTLAVAIRKKRMFIVDLKILKGITTTDKRNKLCSPIALFFVNRDSQLLPIAIQLFQDKADDNPVFLPTDNEYTWMFAKMWFNNADASYHQSAKHLGMTHLIVESMAAATHSCLSPSHPLYRLMAPHFLYLFAINKLGLEELINKGGFVDRTMSIGRLGMFEIIRRRFKTWRLDVDGTFPRELESRGVYNPNVLPNYHYRDDGLLLWHVISKYVVKVVNAHYDMPDKIDSDYELQDWHKTLSSPVISGGCGIQGIPGEGGFRAAKEIAQAVTAIIFTSSVMHAAVNFRQYDNYGFPPHYPSMLNARPPKNKNPKQEKDIVNALPDKGKTLEVMKITKLLSVKGTNGLGEFEVDYQFDPVGTKAVRQFKRALETISANIDERNRERETEYTDLHPIAVPNSISI
ncbi:polyunsaturated fatty acid 5-lipoxygenase-like [Antedon mediterranea]|uniref:polyunsaturated fatty acid 5-lipoxygenase-like n=1 Tax=Antedon mediterranea TaxID=105859 RepID=UPI003AF73667